MQASSSQDSHGTTGPVGMARSGDDYSRGAYEAVEELAEELLKIYLHCPALGKAGGSGKTIMALYLESQDLLDTHPQTALWTARRGLRLASNLLAELGYRHRVRQGEPGKLPLYRAGCPNSRRADDRWRRPTSLRRGPRPPGAAGRRRSPARYRSTGWSGAWYVVS